MCVWPRGIWRCLMSVYFLIQCILSLLKSSLNFESWSMTVAKVLPLSWPLDPFHVLIKKYDGRSPYCCLFTSWLCCFRKQLKTWFLCSLWLVVLAECSLWCVQGRLFFYYSFVAWVYTVRENILCSLIISFVEVLLLFISVCGLSWYVTKTSKMWMLLLMYGFFYICQFYPTASQSQSSLASWCIV